MLLFLVNILFIYDSASPVSLGHEARVWHVSWSPDGKILATCSEDRTVRFLPRCSFHYSIFAETSFLRLWEQDSTGQWKCKGTIPRHTGTVRRVEWSPDGQFLASCSFDKKAIICKISLSSSLLFVSHLSLTVKKDDEFDSEVSNIFEPHTAEIKSISYSPMDESLFATCSRDRSICVWDESECRAVLQGHTQDIKYVTWHPVFQVRFIYILIL